ncbi:MAG: amidohydrolase family protein [Planctomycetota bacterium]
MIIDCHTHVWQSPEQLGRATLGGVPPRTGKRQGNTPAADPDAHFQQTRQVDKAFVLGFKSKYLEADVPNRVVADYCGRDPQRLFGFAGIDPTQEAAVDELQLAHEELGLRGVTVSPANQDFHPADTRAMDLYAKAEKLGMPILFHPGGPMTEASKLSYSRPHLIDEVARNFPGLRIVIAQLGQPWIEEAILLLAKHRNVYADVSVLTSRPWLAYNALINTFQAGVMGKLLFGSDFPFADAQQCIQTLYSLNQMVQGTNLPVIPREELRGIVERDALELLNLA